MLSEFKKSRMSVAFHRSFGIALVAVALLQRPEVLAQSQGPFSPQPVASPRLQMASEVQARNSEFDITAGSAEIYAAEAERNGIRVTDADVERRQALYTKLYPGKASLGQTKRILLAEKYLEAKRMASSNKDSDSAFSAKWNDSLFASSEEVADARKMARFQDAFQRSDVREAGDKLRDVAQIRMFAERTNAPMWDLDAIQVEGDPAECLAWSGSNCMVNTGEYNAAALQYRIPTALPLDSARIEILRRYLPVKRFADSARALGLDRNRDSLIKETEYKQQATRWVHASLLYGRPVSDQTVLQSLYGRFYEKYFAAREELIFTVIGSSDSVYLDSLYRIYSAWDKRRRTLKRPNAQPPPEPALPWTQFKGQELPEELLAAVPAYQVGQCTPPFRVDMGFFLVRITKSTQNKEVAFKEALPTLIFLAAREKYTNMDSVVEAQARKYYSGHKALYAFPDTLDLQAWLIPHNARRVGPAPSSKKQALLLPDTAAFQSLRLSSLRLPDEIRIRIQDAARNHPRDSAFGPLPDKFGTWHFKIRSRKASLDTLPYRLARKSIVEKLTAPPPPLERFKATLQGENDFFLAIGLAEAFNRRKFAASIDPKTGMPIRTKEDAPRPGAAPPKPEDPLGSARLNSAKLLSLSGSDN